MYTYPGLQRLEEEIRRLYKQFADVDVTTLKRTANYTGELNDGSRGSRKSRP